MVRYSVGNTGNTSLENEKGSAVFGICNWVSQQNIHLEVTFSGSFHTPGHKPVVEYPNSEEVHKISLTLNGKIPFNPLKAVENIRHQLVDNNNVNYNNNSNSKDLFASSIVTMALRAIEKKAIKMNKIFRIYQYITVNTKNMTTENIKGLKTDLDSKSEVKVR